MRKAALYARVSTDGQQKEGTIESQLAELRKQVAAAGHELVKEYIDDGYSGTLLDRPALQQLLADCRNWKIGVVLTTDTDRLSRDTGQLAALLHKFRIYGVHVEFASGQDGLKLHAVVLSALGKFQEAKMADAARGTHGCR
jgi:site-specific DNA recombinase